MIGTVGPEIRRFHFHKKRVKYSITIFKVIFLSLFGVIFFTFVNDFMTYVSNFIVKRRM